MNFKGGSGKTVLTGNIASILSKTLGWKVVVVDLDKSGPMSLLAFGSRRAKYSIKDALEWASDGREVSESILYSPNLGFWILPRGKGGFDQENLKYLPRLIESIKNSYFEGGYVDCVLVDPPGDMNIGIPLMMSVDYIAMPLSLSPTDSASSWTTLETINAVHRQNKGNPPLLGIIPNRVKRNSTIAGQYLELAIKFGALLPYIPDSAIIEASYSRESKEGLRSPVFYAPNQAPTKRLIKLTHSLCDLGAPSLEENIAEMCDFLGLDPDYYLGLITKKKELVLSNP